MRAGRMTQGQQRGLDEGWPKFGLTLEQGPLDAQALFGRSAPLTLEIGFGMGQSLLEMAMAAPEHDFVGVEVHRPGVGALLNGMLRENVNNVRVYSCDAMEVLRMATRNGAYAMGLFDCDVLEKGKYADVIRIDLRMPNMQPIHNIAKNLVYSGSKLNVRMTMIHGRILYEDGSFYTKDKPEEIYHEVNKTIERILQ